MVNTIIVIVAVNITTSIIENIYKKAGDKETAKMIKIAGTAISTGLGISLLVKAAKIIKNAKLVIS